jgi:hypothetical protein
MVSSQLPVAFFSKRTIMIETSFIWDLSIPIALSIFITIALFFFLFLISYAICWGFIKTNKMIKQLWEQNNEK